MDFSGLLTTVFTVTTIIAAAFAGLQRSVVQSLREANKDLRDRDADREKTEIADKAKIASLESDIAALSRVVTGEVHLTALGDKLDEQHVEARQHWAQDLQLSRETLAAIKKLSGGAT